ncbi:MAG TPA: NAD(P)H-binding protein [Propionibacteriaceae bacterium]|nr:NAD(P)H-binding protein [Propionibacteriaceae bacterium]
MRIAVAGGTGLVGRQTVKALRRSGHDAVVIARSVGVDLTTGDGLAAALMGVDAVVDVINTPTVDPGEAREFFATTTRQLLAAERNASVKHHVVLSIVGVDQVEGNGHYAGKRAQERAALDGPVPATIVRATQFFDFAAMVVGWTQRGQVATVPPLLIQPVALADVAEVLAEVAAGEPQEGIRELAGPELQDLVDMARRTLAAQRTSLRLIPSWRGPFGVEMAGEVLLPGPGAHIAPTTFETWLAAQAVDGGRESVQMVVDGDSTPLPTLRGPAGDAVNTGVDVDANGLRLRSDGAGCRLAERLAPTGIYSVAVQVRHLDRSLAFYRDLLGLRLQHQEGQMAQLHGYGDTAPSLVLLEVGGHAPRLGGGSGLVRVAWRVDKQADLDLAEQLLQREGLTYQRRREEGLDIVDTRDPDRTHVLLVWLSPDVVADDRLPPRLHGWE